MAFCRKCGAKLDEDARFCRVCGAPIEETTIAEQASHAPRKKRIPLMVIIGVSIAVFVLAFFVALTFAPLQSVSFHQQNATQSQGGVNTIKLVFDADVANVNVVPTEMTSNSVVLDVSASGSIGLFGDPQHPLQISFTNQTVDSTMTVTARVSQSEGLPVNNLRVNCVIYVNPSVTLDLTVRTTTGRLTMGNDGVNRAATYNALTLQATTGNVEARFNRGVFFKGDVAVTTTTGNAQLIWNNAEATQNINIRVASTTGEASTDITQDQAMSGNVTLTTETTTGSANLQIKIQDGVGAKIESQLTTGDMNVNKHNFNGQQSPLESSNYPAQSNFLINQKTTTGNIFITAVYDAIGITLQERVRDDVITYLLENHSETAQFMQNLTWTGGRVTPEGIDVSEKYTYLTTGWNVTMTYPVVQNPTYTVTLTYTNPVMGIPYSVTWKGTWQNGAITQTEYTFAQ